MERIASSFEQHEDIKPFEKVRSCLMQAGDVRLGQVFVNDQQYVRLKGEEAITWFREHLAAKVQEAYRIAGGSRWKRPTYPGTTW